MSDGTQSAVDVGDPRRIIRSAEQLADAATALLDAHTKAQSDAGDAYAAALAREVHAQLAAMPIDALQQATEGRVRVGMVESAGYRSVAMVRDAGAHRLQAIKGVGPKTAAQLTAACERIEAELRRTTIVRFDVEQRPAEHTALLIQLEHLGTAQLAIDPLAYELRQAVGHIDADIDVARLQGRRIRRLFAGRRRKAESHAALERIAELVASAEATGLLTRIQQAEDQLIRPRPDPWQEYLARPVAYNTLVAEISGVDEGAASRGFLPDELVARIEAVELNTELLDVSLRGYQAFGAKFALAQVRTILGDEMGLGKTIQALAVFCHLRPQGYLHFLVVCPASVLANWEHEIARHSRLEPIWRLHGPDRDTRMRQWQRNGGVAITTFGTLSRLGVPDIDVAAIVIDEAHYVKNPDAQRTQAVEDWLVEPSYTMLMSGTPMENRVDEFRSLVQLVRPDIATNIDANAGLVGADRFRETVAPVYLRRNQEDVLAELPPKIETTEWLTLDGASFDVYRDAVATGNFMAMRRAAFMTPDPGDSPKLIRLLELVAEAVANRRKVVVFSYFRDVLDRIDAALGAQSIGQINGSIAATERQAIVDRFTESYEPTVLVSQIEAGGVGLNIQAASVVILTEPQWKPSTEEQAIARSHRMGQVRPVEVHRLLAEHSVDEHMTEVLARKSELFGEYAGSSDLAEAAPGAVDVSDAARVAAIAEAAGNDSIASRENVLLAFEQRRLGLVQD